MGNDENGGVRVPGKGEISESAGRLDLHAIPRVLLVEDDDANRTILGEFLRTRGYLVDEASSGHEALALAASPHDLIVLDIQLPGMDGLEVLARLRASGEAVTPVLAFTALAMEGDRERILAAGADAYLSKPAPIAVLGEEIRRLLEARRTQGFRRLRPSGP